MYVKKSKQIGAKILTLFFNIFFGFWGLLWLICLLGALSGDADLVDDLGIYLVFFIKNVIIIYFSIRHSRFCSKVREYALYFERDADGIIDVAEFARLKGLDQARLLAQLEKMIHKGYFEHVHLDYNGAPKLVLENERFSTENIQEVVKHMIYVECNHCGASNQVAEGETAQCEYCGGVIQG